VALAETPFYFPGKRSQLFAVLHETAVPHSSLPFVICHPFGEEKLWAHRALVSLARVLADNGHPVLRFDLSGNGDSEGEFSDFSVETAIDDIGAAVDLLKSRTAASQVGLLGLRLGATFASRTAETRDDIAALVLWAPIVDGHRYMQELLRINLTTQLAVFREIRADRDQLAAALRAGHTVNVDGYEIGHALFEQLSTLKLTDGPKSFSGRCLIVQVDKQEAANPSKDLEDLRGLYANATLQSVREDPFWKEIDRFYYEAPNLAASTMRWLHG
jgi:exosortase A-associated hydrolase 2